MELANKIAKMYLVHVVKDSGSLTEYNKVLMDKCARLDTMRKSLASHNTASSNRNYYWITKLHLFIRTHHYTAFKICV